MKYKEYKEASKRHLHTCLSLKKVIQNKYEGRVLNVTLEQEQQKHLFNLYYLSGYIIECRLNYAILEYINFDNIARLNSLNSCKKLRSHHNNYGVSFNQDKRALFALYQPAHKFQPNIHFFVNGSSLSGIGHIRGINGNRITPLHVRNLFHNWNVGYRYETYGQTLVSSEVFDFLDFAKEVYLGLRNLGY